MNKAEATELAHSLMGWTHVRVVVYDATYIAAIAGTYYVEAIEPTTGRRAIWTRADQPEPTFPT